MGDNMNLVLGSAKPATTDANTKKVKVMSFAVPETSQETQKSKEYTHTQSSQVTSFAVPQAIASQTMRDYGWEQTAVPMVTPEVSKDMIQYEREQQEVTVVRPQASVKIIANNVQRKEQHIAMTNPEAFCNHNKISLSKQCTVTAPPAGDRAQIAQAQETAISTQIRANSNLQVLASPPTKASKSFIDTASTDNTTPQRDTNHGTGGISNPFSLENATQEKNQKIPNSHGLNKLENAIQSVDLNPNKKNSTSILGTVLGHWIARAHAVNQKPYTRDQAFAQHMFLFRASHAPTLLCKQSEQALKQQAFLVCTSNFGKLSYQQLNQHNQAMMRPMTTMPDYYQEYAERFKKQALVQTQKAPNNPRWRHSSQMNTVQDMKNAPNDFTKVVKNKNPATTAAVAPYSKQVNTDPIHPVVHKEPKPRDNCCSCPIF
jgi:hypothetical protein